MNFLAEFLVGHELNILVNKVEFKMGCKLPGHLNKDSVLAQPGKEAQSCKKRILGSFLYTLGISYLSLHKHCHMPKPLITYHLLVPLC
jgi:hypothetical protein